MMTGLAAVSDTSLVERCKGRHPIQPNTIEETGLNILFLVELITKILFVSGQLRLIELVNQSKLSIGVLEPLIAFMRTERLCEVSRSSDTETSIAYNLTELGRLRAEDYLRKSQYSGPAPVGLQVYTEQVHKQSIVDMKVTHATLAQAFAELTVKPAILKQFGAAMNSGCAIFIYGPPGSGKTFIAEHLIGLLSGEVSIPYAIAVDNEVIQIFDPKVHEPILGCDEGVFLERRFLADKQWVVCKRPVIKTGGELSLSILDLDFDESCRFYQAPPQLKANNGLLIIDDLGRQLTAAKEIMNCWIVPLDRHVDYLALHSGKKLMLPFDLIVVFSTNMPPSELADEAFLRRLGYKIYVGSITEAEYREIARQVCKEIGIPYSGTGINYLLFELHYKKGKPLLACIPHDILRQVKDHAVYEGVSPQMSEALIDWAWNNYYTHD